MKPRLVIGGLSSDPRERAMQLARAPESAEMDIEIRSRERYPDTVLLQVLTRGAMRWIERRFKLLPVPQRMHRSAIYRVLLEQVEIAADQIRAAGLIAGSLQ